MTESWASSPAVRRSMQGNVSKWTKPELDLLAFLRSQAPDICLRMWGHASDLPGTPEFAFRDEKVAVFLHGCFWHRHDDPRHKWRRIRSHSGFWREKFSRNRKRDARVAKQLRRAGWSVLVVWECRLRVHPGHEVVRIARAVRARRGPSAGATVSP